MKIGIRLLLFIKILLDSVQAINLAKLAENCRNSWQAHTVYLKKNELQAKKKIIVPLYKTLTVFIAKVFKLLSLDMLLVIEKYGIIFKAVLKSLL